MLVIDIMCIQYLTLKHTFIGFSPVSNDKDGEDEGSDDIRGKVSV